MNKPRTRAIAGVDMGIQAKKDLEVVAKSMGLSLSGLFKTAMQFYLGFDKDFKTRASTMARDMGIGVEFCIMRLALLKIAEWCAIEKYYGAPVPRMYPEFQPGLNSQEFFDLWLGKELKQLQLDDPEYQAELLTLRQENEKALQELSERYGVKQPVVER